MGGRQPINVIVWGTMRGKRIETYDFFQVATENGIVDLDGSDFGHGDSMGLGIQRGCVGALVGKMGRERR